MLRMTVLSLMTAPALLAATVAFGQAGHGHHHDHAAHSAEKPAAAQADAGQGEASRPYLLTTCPVSGQPLGSMGEPSVIQYEGREVRFCCPACEPQFRENAAKYLAEMDQALADLQRPTYPLDTCPVGEVALGEMGEPHEIIHEGKLVRFCCAGCVDQFKADPQETLAKIDAAVIEQQKADYPLDTCVISGEPLPGDDTIDAVVGTRLVRLCCEGCKEDLMEDPHAALAKIDAARKGTEGDAIQPAAPAQPEGHGAGHGHHDHSGHAH